MKHTTAEHERALIHRLKRRSAELEQITDKAKRMSLGKMWEVILALRADPTMSLAELKALNHSLSK
jgi:hypothetical protein